MKKLLVGLLALGSISSFAQVTPIVSNLIENMENRGIGVMVSTILEIKGNYSDEGQSVLLTNLYYQEQNDGWKFGIKRKDSRTVCQSLGYSERIKGTANYKRKDLSVIQNGGFIQRGPNRVLDSIECLKN